MPFNTSDLEPSTRGVLRINGEAVTVPEGANVIELLRAETRRRGITTFSAFVDGAELNDLSEVSDHIEEGHVVEVRTYAKPGHAL
jgi:hypothetical protein